MNYYTLVTKLKEIALKQPNIRFAGSKNIWELDNLPDIKYNVFYITPNSFNLQPDTIEYSLNLYFISRWDETDNNQLTIQSEGIEVLSNIVNAFNEENDVYIEYPGVFTPFYQSFKDVCSGIYLTIRVTVPSNGLCEIEY